MELDDPTDEAIERLQKFAVVERKRHDATPQADLHKFDEYVTTQEDWLTRAQSYLFRASGRRLSLASCRSARV